MRDSHRCSGTTHAPTRDARASRFVVNGRVAVQRRDFAIVFPLRTLASSVPRASAGIDRNFYHVAVRLSAADDNDDDDDDDELAPDSSIHCAATLEKFIARARAGGHDRFLRAERKL